MISRFAILPLELNDGTNAFFTNNKPEYCERTPADRAGYVAEHESSGLSFELSTSSIHNHLNTIETERYVIKSGKRTVLDSDFSTVGATLDTRCRCITLRNHPTVP